MNAGYPEATRAGKELARPAAPPPPFPRRAIVADYCRECGRTSDCWQGCAGGERVYWHDRPVSATMDGKSEARSTTDTAVRRSELLEQKEAAHERQQ